MSKSRCTALCFSLVMLVTYSPLLSADPDKVGFSFLKVSRGARHAGMGDVGLALSSRLDGIYFNPATVASTKTSSVGFMHHEHIFDIRREYLGAATPLFKGVVSIGFDYFKISDIEARENPTELPLGVFDSQDMLFYLGYSRNLSARFAAGVVAKYGAEKIEAETADALMVDAGLKYGLTEQLSCGASIRNLGSRPKFASEKFDLPLIAAGGLAAETEFVNAGIDVSLPKDSDLRINLGAERLLGKYLALRAGYKAGYDDESFGFGAGFTKSIWQVDYAFVPHKSGLGSSHRFSLTVDLK